MKKLKEGKYLSTKQTADLLGISRIAVLQRIKRGAIEAQKVGRNYIIRYSDVVGELTEDNKREIDHTVKKAVQEYGEVFKLLGKE